MNEATAIVQHQEAPAALARVTDTGISIEEIVFRFEKIKEVQRRVMREDQHYGIIPGTPKPTLLKPGAELLCMTFQLDPQFSLTEHRDGDHLEVIVTCTLYHAPTGARLGSGIGSCSTRESKYAYRQGQRLCPKCGKPAIIKGKEEYGGGWVCFKKKDGCGEKFGGADKSITGQNVDRVANPDIADQYNTVRKMACKRAHVAAVLFVTCASELFTQDLEDMPHDEGQGARAANSNGKPVATELAVEALLKRIRTAASVPELDEIRQSCKGARFTAAASKELSAAVAQRRAQLEDPEFRDDFTAEDRESGRAPTE